MASALERKFRSVGTQVRWWGIVASLSGVLIAILVASGGVVIVALWLIMTLQGAIVQYVFRQ